MTDAVDSFQGYKANLHSSCEGGFVITPSDTVDLPYITRALRIGDAGGTLSVVTKNGDVLTFPVQAYETIPLRVLRVKLATDVDVWGWY